MKHFKHFALLLLVATVTVMMASCAKDFQGDIDDLNTKYDNLEVRVKNLEAQAATMICSERTCNVLW